MNVECGAPPLHLKAAEVPEEERLRANEEESDLFITSLFFRGRKRLNDGGALLPFRLSPSHSNIFLFFYFFLPPCVECVHACVQPISPQSVLHQINFHTRWPGEAAVHEVPPRREGRAAAQREAISRLPLHPPCLHLLPRQ